MSRYERVRRSVCPVVLLARHVRRARRGRGDRARHLANGCRHLRRRAALTIEEKKQALATSRSIPPAHLRDLSARTLVGIARLQASVGMLSRACQVYRVLLESYSRTPIVAKAAVEAIQIACKLEDWTGADEFVRIVSDLPGLVERHTGLALRMRPVRTWECRAARQPGAQSHPPPGGT